MAEGNNMLDRAARWIAGKMGVKSVRDQLDENFDNGVQVALLDGLNREQQDRLIRDQLLQKVYMPAMQSIRFKDNAEMTDLSETGLINRDVEMAKALDETHRAVKRLPDEWQDSWLLSLMDAGKTKFGMFESRNTLGRYLPSGRSVMLPFGKIPSADIVVHEFNHKSGHDLNLSRPEFSYLSNDPRIVPDAFVEDDIGKSVQKDFTSNFLKTLPLHKGYYSEEFNPLADRKNFSESMKRYMKGKDANTTFSNYGMEDLAALDPDIEVILKGGKQIGHGEKYKADKIAEAGNYFTRDYGFHDGKWTRGNIPFDTKRRAALSVEAPSILAEEIIKNEEYGNRVNVPKVFKETYERIMDEYRNDPRKKMIREGADFGQKDYSKFKVNASEVNPNRFDEELDMYGNKVQHDGYFRVPTAYGFKYLDEFGNYDDAIFEALRRGSNSFEFRDMYGNWNKVEPEKLKNSNRKPGGVINFDDLYRFYIETPEGKRRGFRTDIDLGSYLAANPEVKSFYHRMGKRDGTDEWVKRGEGGTGRVDPTDAYRKYFTNPERVKAYETERKIRLDRLKELEKAAAKKALQVIRKVR